MDPRALDLEFKFQIGQMVRFVAGGVPTPVVERLLQQCHGGVQRSYAVRIFTQDPYSKQLGFTDTLRWIQEVELEAVEETVKF